MPGQTIDVERLDIAEGNTVELDRVLLVADGDKITVGTPTVDGARVVVTSKGEAKGKKIIVFKYKPKVRYRKKTGHRQIHTTLTIDKILTAEAAPSKPAKEPEQSNEEVIASGT